MPPPSIRSVVFRDYPAIDAAGIQILFKTGRATTAVGFLGDEDYQMIICDWILFGKLPERLTQ